MREWVWSRTGRPKVRAIPGLVRVKSTALNRGVCKGACIGLSFLVDEVNVSWTFRLFSKRITFRGIIGRDDTGDTRDQCHSKGTTSNVKCYHARLSRDESAIVASISCSKIEIIHCPLVRPYTATKPHLKRPWRPATEHTPPTPSYTFHSDKPSSQSPSIPPHPPAHPPCTRPSSQDS